MYLQTNEESSVLRWVAYVLINEIKRETLAPVNCYIKKMKYSPASASVLLVTSITLKPASGASRLIRDEKKGFDELMTIFSFPTFGQTRPNVPFRYGQGS